MFGRYYIFFIISFFSLTACNNEQSNQGDAFYARGEYQKAVNSYNEYLSLNPEDIKSIYNRGRAYEELGNYEKALEDFQHVLQRDPQNINALLSITNDYYVRQKDWENTVFFADKIIGINDDNARAYILKGKALQRLGKVNEALQAYNNAIASDDDNAGAFLARGTLYYAANNDNKACADFRTASALGSEQARQLQEKYCN